MFDNSKKIKVKQSIIRGQRIIIKDDKKTFSIPKDLPCEISKKQITFFWHKDFILNFKNEGQLQEFVKKVPIKVS